MSDETTNENGSKSANKPPYIAYAVIDRGDDKKSKSYSRVQSGSVQVSLMISQQASGGSSAAISAPICGWIIPR